MGKSSACILQKTYNLLSQPDYTFSSMASSSICMKLIQELKDTQSAVTTRLHLFLYGVIKYLHETGPRALNHHKLPVRKKPYFSSSNSVKFCYLHCASFDVSWMMLQWPPAYHQLNFL